MKEKLVELLEAECGFSRYMTDDERREKLADHLIKNGVIILPIPIGTEYYRIVERSSKYKGDFKIIRKAKMNYYSAESVVKDFGNTVFLTEQEAREKMKGD
jgi:hypothetical protein